MTGKATAGPEGSIVLNADCLGPLKGRRPQELRLQQLGQGLLLSAESQPGQTERPLLYGDLRIFSVAELLALISSMQRSGSLTLMVPFARKVIHFIDGRIVAAASDVPDDRLGEVLWRCGMLSLEQLSQVHDLVTPKKKLGAVLVERGLLSARGLYEGIKNQVLEIVYSTFSFERGEFVFIQGRPAVRTSVHLDLPTRQIISEGLRRIEDMIRLEELLPENKDVLVRRPLRQEAEIGAPQRLLLELVDGRRTTGEIIQSSRMEERRAREALARLRRRGAIEVLAAEMPREQGTLPQVLSNYQARLRVIHQALAAEQPAYLQRLESYLGSPAAGQEELFRSVGFDAVGRLDVEALYRNARALFPEDPRSASIQALRAFLDYASFQAMDVLDEALCERMMAKLQQIKEQAGEKGA